MDAMDAARLLTILATVTGREPSAAQAHGWAFALEDLPASIGERALKDALRAEDGAWITPQTLRKHAAPLLRRLAADVRSAKIRRLVAQDWPETRPLPPEVAERLILEWQATNDRGELSSAVPPVPKRLER